MRSRAAALTTNIRHPAQHHLWVGLHGDPMFRLSPAWACFPPSSTDQDFMSVLCRHTVYRTCRSCFTHRIDDKQNLHGTILPCMTPTTTMRSICSHSKERRQAQRGTTCDRRGTIAWAALRCIHFLRFPLSEITHYRFQCSFRHLTPAVLLQHSQRIEAISK